jgi:hypothetical protein
MSRSNPLHHAPQSPIRPRVWPFPASPLTYPTLAPQERPVAPPKPSPASMPDAPY